MSVYTRVNNQNNNCMVHLGIVTPVAKRKTFDYFCKMHFIYRISTGIIMNLVFFCFMFGLHTHYY